MEHLSTFGLSRDPFANEPHLEEVFASHGFDDVERRLQRAAMQGKGLVLVTGSGGSGKTVLVRHWLDELEEELFEACMLVPVPGVIDGEWLLSRLGAQMGVEEPEEGAAALLGQVYEQLAIVREDGRKAVVIIDEAQVLAEAGLLPMLRGLLNLEYEEHRLLTLVLVGLPSLAEAVAAEPALADRVDLNLCLPPLAGDEAGQYLAHRIRGAGGNPAILESAALEALVKASGGIPRRLNTLADNALFEAHLAGRMSATPADVERAVAELGALGSESLPASGTMAASAAAPAAVAAADSGLDGVFADDGPAMELDEVVAAPTAPPVRSAEATVAFLADDDAPDRGAPDATVAMLADEPPANPADAGRTVAILADEPPRPTNPADAGRTVAIMPAADGDGELDDLFADLVED